MVRELGNFSSVLMRLLFFYYYYFSDEMKEKRKIGKEERMKENKRENNIPLAVFSHIPLSLPLVV